MTRVAIVTAASKGIGAAIARELARRGHHVALLARGAEVEALASELGGIGMQGDVRDETRSALSSTLRSRSGAGWTWWSRIPGTRPRGRRSR